MTLGFLGASKLFKDGKRNKKNTGFAGVPTWRHTDHIPPIADLGDAVPETAPEMAPTPSSAKYGTGAKPSETGQSAGITFNISGI
ncbi:MULTISPECIES: hypothetical protein [unclassified Microcoleus]|uniref:hypothetical protein n=1 Tax=unclassified Microcoleus TaxID=2642155 RepID=UPI002FCEB7EC